MNEWLPIDTAPRDSTPFWVKYGNNAKCVLWHPKLKGFVDPIFRTSLDFVFETDMPNPNYPPPVIYELDLTVWMPMPSAMFDDLMREISRISAINPAHRQAAKAEVLSRVVKPGRSSWLKRLIAG